MEIKGIAHVQLTAADFDACQPFHERLLVFLGLTPLFTGLRDSHAQPSALCARPECQIFVMCRILSPSNCIT